MLARSKSNNRGPIQAYAMDEESEEIDIEEISEGILLDWELGNIDSDGIELLLQFTDTMQVSQHGDPDLLFVQLDLDGIQSRKNPNITLPASVVKYLQIPRQMKDEEEQKAVDAISAFSSDGTSSVMTIQFFLMILLSSGMTRLYDLLNELQVVELHRLFFAASPGNLNQFTDYFDSITSIQLIDTQSLVEQNIYMPEMTPLTLNFQVAGYDSSLLLANGQEMIVIHLVHLVAIPLLLIVFIFSKVKLCKPC